MDFKVIPPGDFIDAIHVNHTIRYSPCTDSVVCLTCNVYLSGVCSNTKCMYCDNRISNVSEHCILEKVRIVDTQAQNNNF